MSVVTTHPSAFDKLADSYWQDYIHNRPISGGMAYEARVRACHLDDSVNSLKRLDELLLTIKRELATQSEAELLKKPAMRHLVLFLGFYVGRVLKKHSKQAMGWLPTSSQGGQDRFYQVAILCPLGQQTPAFFVWLSVGAALFASDGRAFIDPITKGHVPQSLYWAFRAYEEALAPPKAEETPTTPPASTHQPAPQAGTDTKALNTKHSTPPPTKAHGTTVKNNHFAEIEQDLASLPAVNDIHHTHYKKAMMALTTLTPPITKDKQVLIRKALQQLQKVATAGNTDAMLQLGLCYFKGRFVKADPPKGVMWVKRAADMNDARAQKLLSRLYYQGFGVAMSTEQGQYWLDRAADNGHAEAIKLKQQFDAILLIKDEQKADAKKDKQYLLMFAIVGVIVVFLLWLLVKFAGNR